MPVIRARTPNEGALSWVAVTPNDAADLPDGAPRCLWVNTPGDLALVDTSGNEGIFTIEAIGWADFQPARVLDTGTDAADIYAVY